MHEGHRSRLVGKVIKGASLYDHELLEALLFNACPRKDVNAEAHRLLDRFGSLSGVFNATERELVKVEGIGRNMAQYLVLIGKALPYCSDCGSFALIKNTREFGKFMATRPADGRDVLEILFMDKDGKVRRIYSFTAENGERAAATSDKLIKIISTCKPYGIFACYKRTSDDNLPTADDDSINSLISEVCKICGVNMYDYGILSAGGELYSYFIEDRAQFR